MKYSFLTPIAILSAVVCGCTADVPENIISDQDSFLSESVIEVSGGNPKGLSFGSRAIEEPNRPGVCDADSMLIWFYEGILSTSNLTSPTITAANVNISDSVTVSVERYADDYAANKLASCLHDFSAGYSNLHTLTYSVAGVAALAFSENDHSKFTTDTKSFGNNFSNLTLSLTGNETPELYFGHLQFPAVDSKDADKKNLMINAQNDLFYYKNNTKSTIFFPNCPVNGTIYRLVSQINLTVTDVPDGEIEKMEMFLSNIPDQITLYGNHGHFYPVSTARHHKGDVNADDKLRDKENFIKVAECNHFHKGEGRISTYLLPSDTGRAMFVRVWYPAGKVKDEAGNPILYRDYEIRPANSVYMYGNDAEVYYQGAAAHLKNGSNLYIYNQLENNFYSYANVRINISGEYDKVLRETTEVELNIEVCPTFEHSHEFNIN